MSGFDPALSVSIIIPTYNRAGLLPRALESVLAQRGEGDEIIVVDDGSTDETQARLAPYRGRILYKRTANGGAAKARNAGLDAATKPLVGFLDSDDEWLPGRLSLQRALLKARPDVLFCFGEVGRRWPDGRREAGVIFAGNVNFLGERVPLKDFLAEPVPFSAIAPLPAGLTDFSVRIGDLYPWQMESEYALPDTILARRSSTRFPEDQPTREEWEYASRLSRLGRAAFLERELALVHAHEGQQLSKMDFLKVIEARLTALPRVWGVDADFLARGKVRYEDVLDYLKLRRAALLLGKGRREEARLQLAQVRRAAPAYRLLSLLPGGALSFLRGLRGGGA